MALKVPFEAIEKERRTIEERGGGTVLQANFMLFPNGFPVPEDETKHDTGSFAPEGSFVDGAILSGKDER